MFLLSCIMISFLVLNYYRKKLAPKHEAHTKVSSEKVKKALLIQNSPPEKKPSLSGIGSTTTTKVMTASLEKSDKKIGIEKKNEPEKSDKKIIVIKPKTEPEKRITPSKTGMHIILSFIKAG